MPRMQQQPLPIEQPMMPPMQPPLAPPPAAMPTPTLDFGMQMPPMEPAPLPDLELDFGKEFGPMEGGFKKKGLFGMFKK